MHAHSISTSTQVFPECGAAPDVTPNIIIHAMNTDSDYHAQSRPPNDSIILQNHDMNTDTAMNGNNGNDASSSNSTQAGHGDHHHHEQKSSPNSKRLHVPAKHGSTANRKPSKSLSNIPLPSLTLLTTTTTTASTDSSPSSAPSSSLSTSPRLAALAPLSASFTSLSTLTLSGSAQIKERLSQLRQTATAAHVRAVGVMPRVDFVPASIPPARRFQTLAVAFFELCMPIMYCIFFLACSCPPLWPLVFAYYIWIHYIDKAPVQGGRPSYWFRSLPFWTYFAEYYPASMLKEHDLPGDRKYIFGYHPHGIIGMGAFATFATEATGFSSAFPGIHPHLLTLASNFKVPLYRDMLLALGVCSVSRKSCLNILREGAGSAICIVVGGAAESLSAHPGTADLTLRRRLGFIKLAIESGADLVPVFSFGENDIFEQMRNENGTVLYMLQKRFQSMFGFTLPLFHGRGMLNYNLGLLPYRRRIVSVIGRPINVTQNDKPTLEQVHAVQKMYIEELYRIWDTYKDAFAANRKRELNIID